MRWASKNSGRSLWEGASSSSKRLSTIESTEKTMISLKRGNLALLLWKSSDKRGKINKPKWSSRTGKGWIFPSMKILSNRPTSISLNMMIITSPQSLPKRKTMMGRRKWRRAPWKDLEQTPLLLGALSLIVKLMKSRRLRVSLERCQIKAFTLENYPASI